MVISRFWSFPLIFKITFHTFGMGVRELILDTKFFQNWRIMCLKIRFAFVLVTVTLFGLCTERCGQKYFSAFFSFYWACLQSWSNHGLRIWGFAKALGELSSPTPFNWSENSCIGSGRSLKLWGFRFQYIVYGKRTICICKVQHCWRWFERGGGGGSIVVNAKWSLQQRSTWTDHSNSFKTLKSVRERSRAEGVPVAGCSYIRSIIEDA